MSSNYKKVVELLKLEAAAVERSAINLNETAVDRAIEILLACASKVVVMGVGKSGVIAQKIAQTLTSTGTVAVFVHPSDALHGSLGIVSQGDVAILLSNSGETDEIVALLPPLKNRGVRAIAIVGSLESTLAKCSDVVLDASVDKEACPLNLAPTASTTVALAIGDALAMTLMQSKGLTPEDFAVNHPAGRLGKRLTLRVGDLMHPSPSVAIGAGWLEVVKAISTHALGAVNIVYSDNVLAGIITDGDLRRTIERTEASELTSLRAGRFMTASPVTVEPSTLAFDALKIMENRSSQISVLPVVDAGQKCVGLLRLHDIVRAGI